MQIRDSLPRHTAPIILIISQILGERRYGKCPNCHRLQPPALVDICLETSPSQTCCPRTCRGAPPRSSTGPSPGGTGVCTQAPAAWPQPLRPGPGGIGVYTQASAAQPQPLRPSALALAPAATGEHVIASVGDLHLEICHKDLQQDWMSSSSGPVVAGFQVQGRRTCQRQHVRLLLRAARFRRRLSSALSPSALCCTTPAVTSAGEQDEMCSVGVRCCCARGWKNEWSAGWAWDGWRRGLGGRGQPR